MVAHLKRRRVFGLLLTPAVNSGCGDVGVVAEGVGGGGGFVWCVGIRWWSAFLANVEVQMLRAPFVASATLAVAMVACSSGTDVKLAEKNVSQFHESFNAGRYVELFERASPALQRLTTQLQWVALLDAVHRKLGDEKSASRQTWRVTYQVSGNAVSLTYKTVFSGGEADEQFVYQMGKDAAILIGYHINSNALIIS